MIQFQHDEFTVFESQLYKTTSVVVHTKDVIIVVDPNLLPNEVEEIRQYVNEIKENKPIYLIFTHSDWDHIVGYGAFPEAKVVASDKFAQKESDEILEQLIAFDNEYYIDRPYPLIYPKVDIEVKFDGQQLHIGDTMLTFYKADGHTDDGIFTVIDRLGLWIAGDYLSNVEFPFIYDHSKRYEETLLKIDAILTSHKINFLVPGHGHLTNKIDEIKKRQVESLTYIKLLRKLIKDGKESFHLIEQYNKALKKCHEENIQQIIREITS